MRSIKELREEAGISQVELSRLADIHTSALSRYEKGHTIPSVEVYEHIINVLGYIIEIKEERK